MLNNHLPRIGVLNGNSGSAGCVRDTTYIYDIYYIRTHVYVLLFSVKNACLNYCELDLDTDLVGVPHTWYLCTKTCWKRVGHGGFE